MGETHDWLGISEQPTGQGQFSWLRRPTVIFPSGFSSIFNGKSEWNRITDMCWQVTGTKVPLLLLLVLGRGRIFFPKNPILHQLHYKHLGTLGGLSHCGWLDRPYSASGGGCAAFVWHFWVHPWHVFFHETKTTLFLRMISGKINPPEIGSMGTWIKSPNVSFGYPSQFPPLFGGTSEVSKLKPFSLAHQTFYERWKASRMARS